MTRVFRAAEWMTIPTTERGRRLNFQQIRKIQDGNLCKGEKTKKTSLTDPPVRERKKSQAGGHKKKGRCSSAGGGKEKGEGRRSPVGKEGRGTCLERRED